MTQFLRRHAVRIVIGVVLVAAAYFAISVYGTYQREQRIAAKCNSLNGFGYQLGYRGPAWIPQSLQSHVRLFDRITFIGAYQECVVPGGPAEPELIDHAVLEELLLDCRTLHSLEDLGLSRTQVNDADLEHLKGLFSLRTLDVDYTRTTAAGRAMLRKALPNCKIHPDP